MHAATGFALRVRPLMLAGDLGGSRAFRAALPRRG